MGVHVSPGPWFAPGLTPAQRIGRMEAHLHALGWRIRLRGRPLVLREGASWADPVTRTLRLRRSWTRYAPHDAALLAHELTHAIQAGRPWWRRWLFGLRAVLDRWFTLRIEVEAEAHELAMAMECGVTTAPRPLGGWRLIVESPAGQSQLNLASWTPGDPDDIERDTVVRAVELQREAHVRWRS